MSIQVHFRRVPRALCALLLSGCASTPGEWRVEREDLLLQYTGAGRGRSAMVVDIDDTLVDGGAWSSLRLALGLAPSSIRPFPGAPAVLRLLLERRDIILLSVRDDSLAARTLSWLEASGFPPLPVVFSPRFILSAGGRTEFKTQALLRLERMGIGLETGIGDKAGDILAYTRNGLESILVLDGPDDPDLALTLEALGATAIGPRSSGSSSPGCILLSRETCWQEIREMEAPLSSPAPSP